MNKIRTARITFFIISIFIVTACKLPIELPINLGPGSNTGNDGTNNTGNPTTPPIIEVIPPSQDVDPKPVGIKDGLGSLDSYQTTFTMNSSDSKGARTSITEFMERSVVDKNSHSVVTTVMFDPENDDEETNETMETYSIGLETCTNSDDEWEYDTVTEQEKEMRDVFSNLIDVIPLIDNPQFVGEEMMNGVITNHFQFKIEGIGDNSGSVATINSGDYWLAKDGQYIVKYHVLLQIRSAAEGTPDAEVADLEATFELANINIPIVFTLPVACHP